MMTGARLCARVLFRNLGVYVEDTWRVIPRLTVSRHVRSQELTTGIMLSLPFPDFLGLRGDASG